MVKPDKRKVERLLDEAWEKNLNGDEKAASKNSATKGKPTASLSAADLINRFGLVFVWLVLIVCFSLLSLGTFLRQANFSNIFGSQAVLVILTMGMLTPLIVGEFDPSAAGLLPTTLMIIGVLNVVHDWPIGWVPDRLCPNGKRHFPRWYAQCLTFAHETHRSPKGY